MYTIVAMFLGIVQSAVADQPVIIILD